jgi:plasmid stabilization system protein ParE
VKTAQVHLTERFVSAVATIVESAVPHIGGERAERLGLLLIDKALSLGLMPRRGRVVPELGNDSLRELIVSKHRVIYRVNEDASVVEVAFAFWGALPFPYDEILDG